MVAQRLSPLEMELVLQIQISLEADAFNSSPFSFMRRGSLVHGG